MFSLSDTEDQEEAGLKLWGNPGHLDVLRPFSPQVWIGGVSESKTLGMLFSTCHHHSCPHHSSRLEEVSFSLTFHSLQQELSLMTEFGGPVCLGYRGSVPDRLAQGVHPRPGSPKPGVGEVSCSIHWRDHRTQVESSDGFCAVLKTLSLFFGPGVLH